MDHSFSGGSIHSVGPDATSLAAWRLDDWRYIPAHYAYISAMLVRPGLMQFVAATRVSKALSTCSLPGCFTDQYFPNLTDNGTLKLQIKIPLFSATAAAGSEDVQLGAGASGSSSSSSAGDTSCNGGLCKMPAMTVYSEVDASYVGNARSGGGHLKQLCGCLYDFQDWRKMFFEKVSSTQCHHIL